MFSIVDKQDWPWCEICGKPVDAFNAVDTNGNIYLVAQCHGDTTGVRIPEQVLADAKLETMEFGPAFTIGGDYEKELVGPFS